MNPALENAVSQITRGFYFLAGAMVVVGVVALLVGRKFGGKTKVQRRATGDLVWAIGLLLVGILLIPRLFGGGN